MSDITSQVIGSNAPGGESQSGAVESFSFGNLHEQALSVFENGDTPAADAAVEQVAAPEAAGTEVEEPAQNIDNASDAKLAQLTDDQLVEVTVDGQKVQVPWGEARGGIMRQAKFTKEMQQLRQQQQQFDTERQTLAQARQERDALVQVLNNKELVARLISEKYPELLSQAQAAASAQLDPNDIASVGQVQDFVAGLQQHFEQQLTERVEQVTQTIEERQVTAKLAGEINTTIGSLFEAHPYMKRVIPNAEDNLRHQVALLRPQTPEEATQAFKDVFQGWVDDFKATVAEQNKAAVVTKQKLVSNNIQPPGGAQVQPTPTSFKKTNPHTGKQETDWDALRNAALNMMS